MPLKEMVPLNWYEEERTFMLPGEQEGERQSFSINESALSLIAQRLKELLTHFLDVICCSQLSDK